MKQRDITYIDGFGRYGCYIACELSFVERHLHRSLTKYEVLNIWDDGIRLKYILNNEIPIGKKGWYRCFVARPVELFNLALRSVSLNLRIASVAHSSRPGPDFVFICYDTRWGYHFALGNSAGREIVNPDPNLPVLGVNSYRVFKLAR